MTGTVERLQVEPVIPMARNKPPIFAPEPEIKTNKLLETFNALLPVFGALAAILAIRLFLLFAIVGAFILAQTVLEQTTTLAIWVLVSYCAFTILPLVFLEIATRKKS